MSLGVLQSKVYLDVPFSENEQAKQLGARFDWDTKKWYIFSNHSNLDKLQEKWKIITELPTKVYLAVSFSENEQAKQLGARFDWDTKKWYTWSDNSNLDKLQEQWKINTEPVILTGEDRTYGGNDLFIDLIPQTCWFTNVRYCTDSRDWDRLRNHVYSRVNNTCECCHNKTNDIEAHERWHYDADTKTQKLVRLVALCNMCHTTTHMGLAQIRGKGDEALEHLKQVRNFTQEEVIEHKNQAFQVWRERNEIEWNLDLSLLTDNNIKLSKNVSSEERVNIMEKTLSVVRNNITDRINERINDKNKNKILS